ncbi:hypothetical protein F0562_004723 [Nyssa sinensis]|uniref:YDG domain-containing protein n=1 Tax=Nyssa sinensis TaxID=561372 RepID=A0A5J5C079_9ASTE|nr:hypothetical protein F0562_004723 [Nyssa sinensis]
MVVQSLHCVNACENHITTTSIDTEVITDHRHLMVSGVSMNDNGTLDCEKFNGNKSASPLSERRTSARIQKLMSEKALRVRRAEELSNHVEEKVIRKKTRVYQRRKVNLPNVGSQGVENKASEVDIPDMGPNETKNCANVEVGAVVNMGLTEVAESGFVGEKSAYARVTETLRTFNKHYLHFVQKGDSLEDDTRRGSKRPDLKAITKMMETNAILNPTKRFGPIPGVDVGHQFFSRAEMVAVGFP